MLRRLRSGNFVFAVPSCLAALACAVALTCVASAQDHPSDKKPAADQKGPDQKKEWKERAEYELYLAVTKSTDPNQWLLSLDKWKAQYPQSDFADLRRQLYLASYRALMKPRDAFDAATEVLQDNPVNLAALSAVLEYIYPLVPFNPPQLAVQQSRDLDTAEQAAEQLRENLDQACARDNRPPDMTDEQVVKAKPMLRLLATRAAAYVALERKNYPKAQAELMRVLDLDTNQGQVSFWLGTAILAESKSKPELQPVAMFDFARAAVCDGASALPNNDRQTLAAYLRDVYVKYHGSAEGLEQLMSTARSSALPPAGFTIESRREIEARKLEAEEALERANPSLGLWKRVRGELQRDGGPTYFENSVKGFALPGGANGVMKFKGKLVSMMPAIRPKELVLAVESPDHPDAILKLDSTLAGKMDPGAEIEFEGVADSYTKDPFMLTFNVEKAKIVGWAGKTPVQKKSVPKKKAGL